MSNRKRLNRKGGPFKKRTHTEYIGSLFFDDLRKWDADKKSRRKEHKVSNKGNLNKFRRIGLF